jgi:hypothetical protein
MKSDNQTDGGPVTEQNETGDQTEPVDAEDEITTEAPAAAPDVPPVVPAASKLPSWVTRTRLIATGAAAAIFLGGGAAGYALGNAGSDDHGRFPDRFDRGFAPGQGPDGQFPGGQGPGGQQGQAPQSQSQSQSQS